MSNGNRPAMPLGDSRINYNEVNELVAGLTKREYFAAMAMQGLIQSEPHWAEQGYVVPTDEDMAKEALNRADALLKALEANNENN